MAAKWPRNRWWLPAGCALTSIAIILGLTYAVYKAKQAARRMTNRSMLKQIGLALDNFERTYNRLPPAIRRDPAGRPLCSWRFQILPYLESWMGAPAMEFGEPWDAPANEFYAKVPYRLYCWSPPGSPEQFHTNIVAVTGPDTPFAEDRIKRLQDMPGTTILLVEIAHSGIPWMAPGDLSLDGVGESLVHGVDRDGFHVLFADEQVWFLSAAVPVEAVRPFFTMDGAKTHDREQRLGPYALYR
jgi:hypothetical protein